MIPADTHKEAYDKQREIWFAKTPGERLAAGLQMMDDMKALMESGIRQRNPGISAIDVKIEWFKQMYKNDFEPEE
jgi:hypothetical protein